MARCAACGDEHPTADCPDDTEGRKLYRGRAQTMANLSINLTKYKARIPDGKEAKT